jgi:hypothetical protein
LSLFVQGGDDDYEYNPGDYPEIFSEEEIALAEEHEATATTKIFDPEDSSHESEKVK